MINKIAITAAVMASTSISSGYPVRIHQKELEDAQKPEGNRQYNRDCPNLCDPPFQCTAVALGPETKKNKCILPEKRKGVKCTYPEECKGNLDCLRFVTYHISPSNDEVRRPIPICAEANSDKNHHIQKTEKGRFVEEGLYPGALPNIVTKATEEEADEMKPEEDQELYTECTIWCGDGLSCEKVDLEKKECIKTGKPHYQECRHNVECDGRLKCLEFNQYSDELSTPPEDKLSICSLGGSNSNHHIKFTHEKQGGRTVESGAHPMQNEQISLPVSKFHVEPGPWSWARVYDTKCTVNCCEHLELIPCSNSPVKCTAVTEGRRRTEKSRCIIPDSRPEFQECKYHEECYGKLKCTSFDAFTVYREGPHIHPKPIKICTEILALEPGDYHVDVPQQSTDYTFASGAKPEPYVAPSKPRTGKSDERHTTASTASKAPTTGTGTSTKTTRPPPRQPSAPALPRGDKVGPNPNVGLDGYNMRCEQNRKECPHPFHCIDISPEGEEPLNVCTRRSNIGPYQRCSYDVECGYANDGRTELVCEPMAIWMKMSNGARRETTRPISICTKEGDSRRMYADENKTTGVISYRVMPLQSVEVNSDGTIETDSK